MDKEAELNPLKEVCQLFCTIHYDVMTENVIRVKWKGVFKVRSFDVRP